MCRVLFNFCCLNVFFFYIQILYTTDRCVVIFNFSSLTACRPTGRSFGRGRNGIFAFPTQSRTQACIGLVGIPGTSRWTPLWPFVSGPLHRCHIMASITDDEQKKKSFIKNFPKKWVDSYLSFPGEQKLSSTRLIVRNRIFTMAACDPSTASSSVRIIRLRFTVESIGAINSWWSTTRFGARQRCTLRVRTENG